MEPSTDRRRWWLTAGWLRLAASVLLMIPAATSLQGQGVANGASSQSATLHLTVNVVPVTMSSGNAKTAASTSAVDFNLMPQSSRLQPSAEHTVVRTTVPDPQAGGKKLAVLETTTIVPQ